MAKLSSPFVCAVEVLESQMEERSNSDVAIDCCGYFSIRH